MRCTISSDENETIPFKLQQTGSNTFHIKLKSNRHQLDTKKSKKNAPKKEKEETAEAATAKTTTTKRRLLDEPLRVSKRPRIDEPKYDLRPQLKPADPQKKIKKATTKKQLVIYKGPKAMPCKSVKIGDVVLCKMRGFCRWPAHVTDMVGNSIFVEFFGDKTTQKSKLENLFSFNDSSEDILENLKCKKDPLFSKAVKEAEGTLKIPKTHSIFNKL